MVWFIFFISALVVVVAAIKLAEFSDVIAVRTKLGGMFVGTILLAGATSLPEMIASISSFRLGEPNLAAGNFFGSNMVNILLLAIIDLVHYNVPLLRRIAINHSLTAALSSVLMLVAIISLLAEVDIAIGWMGVDSLLLIGLYFGGIWLIRREENQSAVSDVVEVMPGPEFPSLRRGVVGFSVSAVILVLIVPILVNSSSDIATLTGLGTGFVGTALLSVITSLPELLAAFAAVRMGSFDLAVGNLFGSNVFNMLAMGVSDLFYTNGRFLGDIDPGFALVGLLGLLLTNMALVGNLARVERKVLFVEIDSLAIILVYLAGMYLLYVKGIGG